MKTHGKEILLWIIIILVGLFLLGLYKDSSYNINYSKRHETQKIRIMEYHGFGHEFCAYGEKYYAGMLDGSHKMIRIIDDDSDFPLKCSMDEEEVDDEN